MKELEARPAGDPGFDFEAYLPDIDPTETADWMDSFDALVQQRGMERAHFILTRLLRRAQIEHVRLPVLVQTPYVNTIPPESEPAYPGDETLELKIRRYVRWNALAMVIGANSRFAGIGGHISTYASAASLYEVGFNHFFRGDYGQADGSCDQIFYQGHAAPGVYARAFLEGRLTLEHMEHFRREVKRGHGLSSYPHPWLMPEFWEFPTVSMGLGPIAAIYQARFNRYLQHRGIKNTENSRVWAFLGDGETDEPEALGALHVAASQGLDNLVFVVNCNLQRLDGPVRGNGKIIQELEAGFHGAGWNVIKVIWGREWDGLLARDSEGLLVRRMGEVVDGQYQKYSLANGAYIREHFFGAYPKLLDMVRQLSDADLVRLRRGGHDMRKLYAAFQAAINTKGRPTVILAKTVKGWTLGEGAEGRNTAHQAKKLTIEELRTFRDRLELPIPDKDLANAPFIQLEKGSPEHDYLLERRKALGGSVPRRRVKHRPLDVPELPWFSRFLAGSGNQPVSTTGAFAQMLAQLLGHEVLGKRVVPIIPDEARTFGLDSLFRKFGIYSSVGQIYEPVDKEMLLFYREAINGQVLEEGITEAGASASFAAAGSSYATHGEPMIPFYIYYSMFGFQRTGDQFWAAGDQRTRGFLLGATAGRTTLNGEGLQHQDGHSHLLASTVPSIRAYDPAFAYELAVIVQDGLRRMIREGDDVFYYITLQNEAYPMLAMPEGAEQGILDGMYLLKPAGDVVDAGTADKQSVLRLQLFGSDSILMEVLRAQGILAERYGVAADVWSVTSYNLLRREALAVERWNMLHPEAEPRVPRVSQILKDVKGPFVAASDYMKAIPDQIQPWVPGGLFTLGTDGFGRSDTRAALRRHFEVDAEHVAAAALYQLARSGALPPAKAAQAIKDLGIDPEKIDPAIA